MWQNFANDVLNFEQDVFVTNDPKDYLAGHIVVGLVAIIQTVVPTVLWWVWKKPMISDSDANKWFKRSWGMMWIGSVIAHGIQAVLFPFTFFKHRTLGIIYAGSWAFLGIMFAAVLFFLVNGFLFKAASNYSIYSAQDYEQNECWYTIGFYILFEFVMGSLVKIFLFDSILY